MNGRVANTDLSSEASDSLAPDWFERLDELGERDHEAGLLLRAEALERVADIQTCPALVPRLRLEALSERLLEEQ